MEKSGRQRDDPADPRADNFGHVQPSPAYSRDRSASPGTLQHTLSNGVRSAVLHGNSTSERADAIVNATTKSEPSSHVTSLSVEGGRRKEAKESVLSGMGGKQNDPDEQITRGSLSGSSGSEDTTKVVRGRTRRSTQEDVKQLPGLAQSSEGKSLAKPLKETSHKQASPCHVF